MDADDTRDEAMRAELSPLRDAGDTTMETSLQQAIAPLLDRIAALEERFAALERATAADESSTLGRRHP